MISQALKSILPNHPIPVRIWRGPFRGARIVMNPRSSLRKVFGLYEHDLNDWLEEALRQVNRVLDVGANDGYFTFGCAAAFRRLGISGEITAFEPQERHVQILRESIAVQGPLEVRIAIVHALVGREVREGRTTLDALNVKDRRNTLIKIDVEGAEVEVIAGAQSWMHPSNFFVIEVHKQEYLAQIKETFAGYGHRLRQVDQSPVPVLGREQRDVMNWWLVSNSGAAH